MSNYEQMQTNGRMPQRMREQTPRKSLPMNIISEEGWTPELLDWFIAAISVALERPENRELVTNLKRGSRL